MVNEKPFSLPFYVHRQSPFDDTLRQRVCVSISWKFITIFFFVKTEPLNNFAEYRMYIYMGMALSFFDLTISTILKC